MLWRVHFRFDSKIENSTSVHLHGRFHGSIASSAASSKNSANHFQTTLLAEQISHSDVVGRFYGEHHVFRELRFVVPLLFLLNLVMGS
jgi:hypothetical protein